MPYNPNSAEFALLRYLFSNNIILSRELFQSKVENILKSQGVVGDIGGAVSRLVQDGFVSTGNDKIWATNSGIASFKTYLDNLPPLPAPPEDPKITAVKALHRRLKDNKYASNKEEIDDIREAVIHLLRSWHNISD